MRHLKANHKIGRNDPCWCGSTRKFKRCHQNRDQQARVPVWEHMRRLREAFQERHCLHFDAPRGCSGKVIRAHTVQRASLARIARAGHVQKLSLDLGRMLKNGGQAEVQNVGLREASTFTGFCAAHDSELFRPVEVHEISPTAEQAFLLAHRALCRELSAKRAMVELIPTLRDGDRGQSLFDQIAHQTGLVAGLEEGASASLAMLADAKSEFDRRARTRDFADVSYLALWLDSPPEIMCSGAFCPEFDFAGQPLQNLGDTSKKLDLMSLSLLASGQGGLCLLAWVGHGDANSRFASSFYSLADAEVPDALVRLAFEHIENTYFSPGWWASLGETSRRRLIDRFRLSGTVDQERSPTVLVDDGLRVARMRVLGRDTSGTQWRSESTERFNRPPE